MITIKPDIDEKFIGIPYKLGGRSFEGADCMGMILLWLSENGIHYDYESGDALRMKKYWETSPGKFADMLSSYGTMIPFPFIKKFDFLILFLSYY